MIVLYAILIERIRSVLAMGGGEAGCARVGFSWPQDDDDVVKVCMLTARMSDGCWRRIELLGGVKLRMGS